MLNEDNNVVLLSAIDEAGCFNAYIKASATEELKRCFEEEFVPGKLCRGYSPDEAAALTREDIALYYEDYQAHHNRMK